jgi:hypothetical protein
MSKELKSSKCIKPWQPGWHTMELLVPPGFGLLCFLLRKDMADVLIDLMRSVVADSTEGNLEQHELAKDWFLRRGYHRNQFTTEEGERMFRELESMALLWPHGAPVEFIRQHAKWRNRYYKWWFKKWKSIRRNPPQKEVHKLG